MTATARVDLQDELDAFVEADNPQSVDPEIDSEPQAPVDADSASRLLRRIARLEREGAEVAALAEAEVLRVGVWKADRLSGVTRELEWAQRSLEGFMRHHHGETGHKSIDLPNGVLTLRAPRSRVVIVDQEEFTEWARTHERDDLVRFRIEPDKTALARLPVGESTPTTAAESTALVLDDGAPIPGVVVVTPTDPTFTYKTNSSKAEA